jgi:hypothetical protein
VSIQIQAGQQTITAADPSLTTSAKSSKPSPAAAEVRYRFSTLMSPSASPRGVLLASLSDLSAVSSHRFVVSFSVRSQWHPSPAHDPAGWPGPIAAHAPGTMALAACRRCTVVIGRVSGCLWVRGQSFKLTGCASPPDGRSSWPGVADPRALRKDCHVRSDA